MADITPNDAPSQEPFVLDDRSMLERLRYMREYANGIPVEETPYQGMRDVVAPSTDDVLRSFGRATALSRDGRILAVSSLGEIDAEGHVGVVHIFRFEGGQWRQSASLTIADMTATSKFGASLSLNADGSVLAVGAPGRESNLGAAYLFKYAENSWSDGTPILSNTRLLNDEFGYAVSLSADGTLLAVGAPGVIANTASNGAGRVELFRETGDEYIYDETTPDTPEDDEWKRWGAAVSVSGNGRSVAIGIPRWGGTKGDVKVLYRDGTTWELSGHIDRPGGDVNNAYFGNSVSFNVDGTVLAICAYGQNEAYVCTGSGLSFPTNNRKRVQSSPTVGELYGYSIHISDDGQWLAIGSIYLSNNPGTSAAYLCHEKDGIWVEKQKITHDGIVNAYLLGCSVSLSGDGAMLAIGAPGVGENNGLVKMYDNHAISMGKILFSPTPEPATNPASQKFDVATFAQLYRQPDQADGAMLPHQAFILAFQRMMETPRDLLNALPRAHRQLYYRGLLGLKERPVLPDQVALSMVVDSPLSELMIPAGTVFDGGQDSEGNPRQYALQQSLLANPGQWTDLRWCRHSASAGVTWSRVVYDRDKGLPWPEQGVRLLESNNEQETLVPDARVVSSPLLAMAGGTRTITVEFASGGPTELLGEVSCDGKWLPIATGTTLPGRSDLAVDVVSEFTLTVPADAGPIAPAPGLDGFHEAWPLLKLSRSDGLSMPPVQRLSVTVNDLPDVLFSTDDGVANIAGRSLPFGIKPILGAGFNMVSPDWYGKGDTLTVTLTPEWIDLPSEPFKDWYEGYDSEITNNTVFKIQPAIVARGQAPSPLTTTPLSIFKSPGTGEPEGDTLQLPLPSLQAVAPDNANPRDWPVWLRLELAGKDFLHAEYLRLLANRQPNAEGTLSDLPNPPYTPQLNRILVSYTCHDEEMAARPQYVLTPFGYKKSGGVEDIGWRQQYLAPANVGGNPSRFGVATAVSRDGKVLAVGSPLATTNGEAGGVGVVDVYRAVDGQWQGWKSFTSGSPTNIQFGASLSLNADGSVLAIGAPEADGNKGRVYVSQCIDDLWGDPVQLLITVPDTDLPDGALFGYAVSLSGDGRRLAVSRSGNNSVKSHGIYLYQYTDSDGWDIESTFDNYPGSQDSLVLSVCLSADGRTLAAGMPHLSTGRATASFYNGTGWSEHNTVHLIGVSTFGSSVSLNADGRWLAIGSKNSNGGKARIFRRNSNTSGSLYDFESEPTIPPTVPVEVCGTSVSLSDDGLWMAVGASPHDQSSATTSSAYLFHREGDEWIEKKKIAHNDGTPVNYLGTSVSLSGDGTICAIGAPAKTDTAVGMVSILQPSDALYVGFRNIAPQQDLALHWQLQSPGPLQVAWQYLHRDNYWASLDAQVADQTDALFHSGLWRATLPADAADATTAAATMMPAGRVWLRALLSPDQINTGTIEDVSDYPWLYGLYTNSGMALRVTDPDQPLQVFDGPLPAGAITQSVQPLTGLAGVLQPWPSIGGRAAETENAFFQRVAQRLDHRDRALTVRDIKALLLDRYPELHGVMAISPELDDRSDEQKMVVVPASGWQDNADPLRPMFNAARLAEMAQYILQRASPWLTLQLVNPTYRDVLVEYQIDFDSGLNVSYGYAQVRRALELEYMSWAWDSASVVQLEQGIDYYRMLAFIQQLPGVLRVNQLSLTPQASRAGSVEGAPTDVLVLVWPGESVLTLSSAANIVNRGDHQ
ncbi:hypothetical protein [Collimonas humicola]|uniref:hypothetical protein n=1 Tax=Collimonas humicola TaxID=2825886 RepID=UPI001B8C0669|nr:hypothetical protein [Collimonas humicola]